MGTHRCQGPTPTQTSDSAGLPGSLNFFIPNRFPNDADTWDTLLLLLSHFSRVQLCATPQMAAHQAPPSLGFSRQEYWSGLPLPSPRTYSTWPQKKGCNFTAQHDCFTEPARVDTSLDWNWILFGSVREDEVLSYCSIVMSCSFSKVSEKKIAYFFWSTFHIAGSICFLNLPHRDNLIHSVYKVRRRQWHPTPVLLPGKSHGRRSLVDCSPWGL